uniref:Glycosyl transferase family 1 domain-containing protein n=1 Tax=Erythrolobus madagascarensis TaxID=708628 RepID=A0A7S0XNM0_9RHOD|mmetsp:Transcript_445/g.876  ORF Transcript_445/g.876 Transcript_445/m.876 type:complete len:601 (+) Transcript_445:28-1830(+)|eukprot:CAMPEP_0185844486 /NCGR_PEP_ID=MMETSP1354-20130828/632_1 /TAXON_ID=708628 /ORGANISM="Erythrolobus madagascarensis, Strain CCMP3276" /LENGTH=600 /DNA_ID=CAMNT_0028544159 /DNA_START=22 /DNA_END=1824 /DNA_ORIENTATION=+
MAEKATQSLLGELELPAGADPYEDFDFQPYFEEVKSEDELRKTWRVFTKVKDVLDNGRRLENASWRLWHRERTRGGGGGADGAGSVGVDEEKMMSEFEKFDINLDNSLKQAQERTSRMVGDMFGGTEQRFIAESERNDAKLRAERARNLVEVQTQYGIPDAAIDALLSWVRSDVLQSPSVTVDDNAVVVPENLGQATELMKELQVAPRKRCAAFSHSLERNGANNFLLYLVRELKEELAFTLISPKEGAMREDYESMGVEVGILDMKAATYETDVLEAIRDFDYTVANTIMLTEVVIASKKLDIPSLWVIHEAWPQDQFEYYAKEVFLMAHLDANKIRKSFAEATRIVFPANVQKQCYNGLFADGVASVIYNGIPLSGINTYRTVQSRKRVRADLGYGEDDLLVVQLGTVCTRKGQYITAQAFAQLMKEDFGGKQPKLLMVGARYIRQHEIDYIDSIKKELATTGADQHTTILDVKKNVLPYYLAADVIVCPSLNEVLPLVICEAMAFERPVIASRIDGIPEALSDGIEGFLIPPGEPEPLRENIAKLLHDPELRVTMGTNGRKRVLSQFSFSVMAQHYRETIFGSESPNAAAEPKSIAT